MTVSNLAIVLMRLPVDAETTRACYFVSRTRMSAAAIHLS